MQFSFRKPHFSHPPNFAKTLFWHTVALFVFLKMPQNTLKLGKTVKKKKLGPVLTLNLDQSLTLKPPNLGPVFNFTAYIYVYTYIYRWPLIYLYIYIDISLNVRATMLMLCCVSLLGFLPQSSSFTNCFTFHFAHESNLLCWGNCAFFVCQRKGALLTSTRVWWGWGSWECRVVNQQLHQDEETSPF